MRRRDALVTLAALAASCRKRDAIRVGSKNFSENVLLSEIVAQALERAGRKVERKPNLGGTFVCHRAIAAGDLDVYVEYTGTAWVAILGEPLDPGASAAQIRDGVARAWRERFGAVVLPPLGFDDTFAILVRREDAKRLGLAKVSDLAKHPELRPGFGYEFVERSDGYDAFAKAYGLSFSAKPVTMELGLTYRALEGGKVDVIAGNATDGLIDKLDLVRLEDDRRFFPPYEAVPIVREAVLEKVEAPLRALAGTIDDETMRRLNRAVDVEGQAVADVARRFLEEKRVSSGG